MAEVRPVTITSKDWKKCQEHVKKEYDKRKTDQFRKKHERIWAEVDRQVMMEPVNPTGQTKNDWHSAIELGELAKASEIITADVMRIAFPTTRAWFEAHAELPPMLNPETGENEASSQDEQMLIDGAVRALMVQQHLDFGFKARVALSVKEAFHHGSFVAEANWESAMKVHDGSGIQGLSAPVWKPYSMWNSFPDTSPSVIGANMIYTGSMILRDYMPLHVLKMQKGQGWMTDNFKKIPKQQHRNKDIETQDLEIIKYYGDIVIPQGEGDVYLPNSTVLLANGIIVFYAPNALPYPSILFNGYERMDVRDPYYVSPIMKLAPMHKLASVIANKYVDSVALKNEPPMVYDGNDPSFVQNGGPVIAPAWKGATKGKADVKIIETGDPRYALEGLTAVLQQIKEGTSVDSVRAGASPSADQTATQARIQQARGEVRVVDFVDKLEYTLKTFLYMQHDLNRSNMDVYGFYNPEMDAPDFMRVSGQQLPETVQFEVVGSRGVLGEEERAQKASVVTAFLAGHPGFEPLLNKIAIAKEMYQDAGVKSPERLLNVPGQNPEVEAAVNEIKAQAEQAIQELQAQIFELEKKLAITQSVNDAKVVDATMKAGVQGDITMLKAQVQAALDSMKTGMKVAEHEAKQQPTLSFAEMGSFVKSLESLLEKQKEDGEKEKDKNDKKIETMLDAIKEMNKAVTKLSKPRRIVRDARGNIEKAVVDE